jgi:hypothetical protein
MDLEQCQCDGKTRMQCHQAKFGRQVWGVLVLKETGKDADEGPFVGIAHEG